MKQKVVSVAHSIRLWPVENVLQYAVVSAKAVFQTKGTPHILELVPGSLKVTDDPDAATGVYNKKLTFKVQHPDNSRTSLLYMLTSGWFVAEYVDENGNGRIAGSPGYPLAFSFKYIGGLYECTMQGKGQIADPYTL